MNPVLPAVVLDTNIVLDLFVYQDSEAETLRAALPSQLRWLATAAMREELARVLNYPHIARRLSLRGAAVEEVLGNFDAQAQLSPAAPKAPFSCKDPDDQKFIDLAAQHQAVLLSKDAAVLCMAKRLARLGVAVRRQWSAA